MASELRVNTLKDAAGNNSIATSFVAGGAVKAWQHTNVTTLQDSFNISSVTDTATGKLTPNYSSNMVNALYTTTGWCAIQSQVPLASPQDGSFITTSSHRITTQISNGGALSDAEYIGSAVSGDLA